jgi:hypothetical protein
MALKKVKWQITLTGETELELADGLTPQAIVEALMDDDDGSLPEWNDMQVDILNPEELEHAS